MRWVTAASSCAAGEPTGIMGEYVDKPTISRNVGPGCRGCRIRVGRQRRRIADSAAEWDSKPTVNVSGKPGLLIGVLVKEVAYIAEEHISHLIDGIRLSCIVLKIDQHHERFLFAHCVRQW